MNPLTDRLDRDVRQVRDDIQLLNEDRIVHVEVDGAAKQPFVPSRTVRIEIELGRPSGEGPVSMTPDG